jgi:hypothetical protein
MYMYQRRPNSNQQNRVAGWAIVLSVCFLLIACETVSAATPPEIINLKQSAPRALGSLALPKGIVVGPTIPGLLQGAIPQGLAFLEPQQWLMITCYFNDGRPSVLIAVDKVSGKIARCLTLINEDNSAHTGHVGGVALSGRYVWIGSDAVYRAPVLDVVAAQPVDHLRIRKVFHAESKASYLTFGDDRLWVGEFVKKGHPRYGGKPSHTLVDRQGRRKHAWVCGYSLDKEENVSSVAGRKAPSPNVILSTRDSVQGMAFFVNRIVVCTSFGKSDSLLAIYRNPLLEPGAKPHAESDIEGVAVPVWFLDGKNHLGRDIAYPPRAEGVAVVGNSLAVISESGAKAYQKDGSTPLDSVLFLPLPTD